MNPNREELLFQLALTKPAAQRAEWLDRECGDDAALRARVGAMLAAHEQPETLLATQAEAGRPALKPALTDAPHEAVGQTIGRYKLLEKIGEGGCGVVYVAEQIEPVRRRVALKVIKLGMDTRQVVARFEAERQALAMMDHPNIAKVLDAGTTEAPVRSAGFQPAVSPISNRQPLEGPNSPDSAGVPLAGSPAIRQTGSLRYEVSAGRPYFVMELVRGIKITDYCDQEKLGTRERLELFIKVCQAIQHAHQKGIIHRDLKPSNILVTLHDGVPVPKVIDFGIAKATEGRLTDVTVYTQLHQFIGTPAYMSPEQAEMSGLDVDTRSDIYNLGVLLYELLTGRTPFDAQELMCGGIDAMRRTIREKEPVRPSTRLATLPGEELTTTAKRRSAEAPKLIHLLKGDLDWIAMKCLEKDRTRRYETANGLAADLKRHLNHEPVLARPPSTTYRLQKLVRRHKLAVAAAAAVAAALLVAAGAGVAAWQSQAARNRLLESQRWTAMEKAFLAIRSGDFEDAHRVIAEAELGGLSVADVHLLRGQLAMVREDFDEARRELELAIELKPRNLPAHAFLVLLAEQSSGKDTIPAVLETRYDAMARLTPVTAEDFLFRGWVEQYFDPARALKYLDEAVRLRPSGMTRLFRAGVRNMVAMLTGTVADVERALDDARIARDLLPDHPDALVTDLATCGTAVGIYLEAGQKAEADTALARAEAAARALSRHTQRPAYVLARVEYLVNVRGDGAAALEELGQARARAKAAGQPPVFDWAFAYLLLVRGEIAKAMELVEGEGIRPLMPKFAGAGLIYLSLPDGPARAMEQHRQYMAANRPGLSSFYSLAIPLAVGRKTEAIEGFHRVREQLVSQRSQQLSPRNDWYLKLLDFGCERLSEEELLRAAGSSLWNRCEAHFFAGLRQLGDGNRAAARAHFAKSVATRVYGFTDYGWSRMFLARMDADPNWPPWLPAGKPAAGSETSSDGRQTP